MKNKFNLIGWLWKTDSHEKQMPQKFRRYAGMLIMLLTLGVGQMWAKTIYLKPNSDWKGSSAKFGICYGYDNSSDQSFVAMTAITGTDWYSAEVPADASSKNIYFMRCSSTWKTSDKWTNKWNGFGWFSYSNGDHYVVDGWDSGSKLDAGYESSDNGIKYYKNSDAGNTEWKFNGQSAQTKNLGSVTNLYLKEWFTYEYENKDFWGDHTVMKYNVHRTAASAGAYSSISTNWTSPGDWSDGYKRPKSGHNSQNVNLLSGLGSGKYTMSFYYYDKDMVTTSPTHSLNWTIDAPAVSGGNVTSDGTGTGASGTPFSVADGEEITFTASGSQASTDANSVLYVKWGDDAYSSTTTKTITPTTTKQSMTVKLKYYNSADELSGAETTLTIYYQSTLTPSIGISSISPSPANSGDEVTITASRQNAGTANITYQYSTNGSTWNTIGSATSSTTKTWTVPASTSTTTYYFRAQMTYEATTYTSATTTLKTYGKKTIKVKNTNGWASMLMHRWGGDRTATTWPGDASQISAYGSGQWKQVVLYSSNTSFALVDGSNNDNHTADLTYASSVSDGYCYEIGSGTGGSLTLTSTANCPAKPSVSVSAASSTTNTTATINGSISSNGNDNITDYGFYWSDDDDYDTAEELQTSGTKVQKGTSNYTGDISANLTSLTAGNTIHYITYATNGQGTKLSSVQSFVVPYKVTITKPSNCSAMTPGTGTQYIKVGDKITATAATGYEFSNWSLSGVTLSDPSTSAGVTTSTVIAAANNGTIQPVFTAINYTAANNLKDADGNAGQYNVTYDNTSIAHTSAPSRSGYTVEGYYKEAGWTNKIANTDLSLVSSNTTYTTGGKWTYTSAPNLHIKWQQTLTLAGNGAGSTNGSLTMTYNSKTTSGHTAATRTGYTLNGYYTATSGGYKVINSNGTLVAYNSNISSYLKNSSGEWIYDGTPTLSAQWTANTYTITLDHGVNGSGSGTATIDYDAGSCKSWSDDISQTGYHVSGWYDNSTSAKVLNTDHSFASSDVTGFITSSKWTKAANCTLQAWWDPNNYAVTLDQQASADGYSASGTVGNQSVYYNTALPSITGTAPTAINGWAFMGFYSSTGGEGVQVIDGSLNWVASAEGYTDADSKWIHVGDATLYAYYKKAEIAAITYDATTVEPSGTVSFAVTVSPTPVGSTKLCFTVLYSNDNPLAEQPTITYNVGTGKYSFTAPEASGTYKVQAVLRTGSSCDGGTELDTEEANFMVAGLHTVTVRYKCGDDVIKASTTLDGISPLDWSDAMTAPEIIGYTFSSWTAGDGVTLTDDNGTTTKTTTTAATIKIKAIYDGYLTATYTKKNVIYFNNTLGWEDVWVYFYNDASGNLYWVDNYGSGANQEQIFGLNKPYYQGEHGQMTQIEGTNIWYFNYTDADWYTTTRTKVAFANKDQSINKEGASNTEAYFYQAEAVYRTDFNASKLPMYVPLTTPSHDYSGKEVKTKYYNRGYWMNYPENTGYTLKIYNQKATAGAVELKSIPFEFPESKAMPMELNVDLEAGKTYGFKIWRNDGLNDGNGSFYGNNATMTANSEGLAMTTDASSNCGLQTTAAGNYRFLLNYYEISSNYQYRVSVTYPVAVGDYRIVYTDLATWSGAAHDASWNHPSGVILKNSSETETKKDTVSFFWSYGSTPAIGYQTCTALSAGSASWSAKTAISVSDYSSVLTKKGVYNFIFEQPAGGASISLIKVEPYTGDYYIRVDAANNKWDNYRTDPDHLMTYSEYSIDHGGYSHYYCHWIQTDDRKNIKFVIANDYSPCISDTLIRETASGDWANINNYIDANGNILSNANVRFMWNQNTNVISRAYVDGAQGPGSNNFLYMVNTDTPNKIRWTESSALTDSKVYFSDNENWIYEANIQAQPNAQIRLLSNWGTSNVITQYFKGSSSTSEELIGGSGSTWYDIRLLYDFKTNRLVTAYKPSGEIDDTIKINADVMFIREHQGDIAQLTFGDKGAVSAIKTAYGVMRFNKWTLNNKEKTGEHSPLGEPASIYERSLYWISFPFRVKLSEVFGFGSYMNHWAIQRYDGAARAAQGHFLENGSFWRWMDRNTEYLEPNQGYLLAIDLDLLGESSDVWGPNSRSERIELFFPSYGTMPDITDADVEQTLPEHECTINRAATEGLPDTGDPRTSYNRTIFDSHWNVMSVPTYVNTDDVTFANDTWTTAHPNFLYTWNADDNSITATSGIDYEYHAMHAYMVQYGGRVTWTAKSGSPYSPIVARKTYEEAPSQIEFRLELQQNDQMIDRTYVVLSNDEEVSANFAFGEDMTKEFNKRKAAIFNYTADHVGVAGNTMPMSDQTTVIPVGLDIPTAGEYTFAIPDGTSGVGVTLIDNEAGTRTSLSALDYTVNLTAGTHEGRFVIEISPVHGSTTGVEAVMDDGLQVTGARKMIIDQKLFIIKGDKMYDARGAMVK